MSNGLTSKQEKFCITYVTEGGSLSDAYRAAYNCEKMKPESVNRKAAELMANGKISARISEPGDMKQPRIICRSMVKSGNTFSARLVIAANTADVSGVPLS